MARVTERPGLARALDNLRRGDALVVWTLDRIGRSLGHVVELVAELQAKGIGLKVLTGGSDTTSSTGRLVFGIFATLAEFERDLIKERTMAGLAAARARGRTGGRPRVMTRAKLRTAMTRIPEAKVATARVLALAPNFTTAGTCAGIGVAATLAAPFTEACRAAGLP